MPIQDRFLTFIKKPFVQACALFLAVVFILVLLVFRFVFAHLFSDPKPDKYRDEDAHHYGDAG